MNLEINFPEELILLPVAEALLLPRSIISIRIDTSEGKSAIDKALFKDRLFGLVQPRVASKNGETTIEKIGICAKIIGFEEIFVNDDSFYFLKIVGISRFSITSFEIGEDNTLTGRVNWNNYYNDIRESEAPISFNRDVFLHLLKKCSFNLKKKIDFDVFEYLPNERLVDFSALSINLPREQRQAIIEAVDYNDRALILIELMTFDSVIA